MNGRSWRIIAKWTPRLSPSNADTAATKARCESWRRRGRCRRLLPRISRQRPPLNRRRGGMERSGEPRRRRPFPGRPMDAALHTRRQRPRAGNEAPRPPLVEFVVRQDGGYGVVDCVLAWQPGAALGNLYESFPYRFLIQRQVCPIRILFLCSV
jgi:hypothetical protein